MDLNGNLESRYEIFLKTVSETKKVWGLMSDDDGWAICKSFEYEETQVMPFFSHESQAQALAVKDWEGYNAVDIELDVFIDDWLAGMDEDHLLVGVNWNANMQGKEMEPAALAKKLGASFD